VLPFTKRNARPADLYESADEVVHSDEIEVLGGLGPKSRKGPSVRPSPSSRSQRARPPLDSISDEELTRLMPARPSQRNVSAPPPNSGRALCWAIVPPPSERVDDPSRTLVRAQTVPPSHSTGRSPRQLVPATIQGSDLGSTLGSNRLPRPPRLPHEVPISPDSVPPMALSATVPPSRREALGTLITARTRISPGRPTMVWAAALVAMGVFVGLASAVVARGDADSLVQATAAFVDPARAGGTRASAALPIAADVAPAPAPIALAAPVAQQTGYLGPTPSPSPSPEVVKPASPISSTVDVHADRGSSERASTVSFIAPGTHSTVGSAVVTVAPAIHHTAPAAPKPVAAPAPAAPETSTSTKLASNDAAPPAKEVVHEVKESKPSATAPTPKAAKTHTKHAASDDDVESASAADALARAQLEASLR
jgi:hypothetical protein